MTNPKKLDMTNDVGRDLQAMEPINPEQPGPEQVLLLLASWIDADKACIDNDNSIALERQCDALFEQLRWLDPALIRQQAAELAEARALRVAAEGVGALHASGDIRGSQQGFLALMALRAALTTAPAGDEGGEG